MDWAVGVSWWRLVTRAGDPGLLGPVLLVMALMLGWLRSWREGWWLARAWGIAALLIALLKLLVLSCGQHWMPGLDSPSGHACMAVVAYGALAWIFGSGRPLAARILIGGFALAAILAIAASRVALRFHSVLEVLIGLEVGALGLLSFVVPFGTRRAPVIDFRVPLAALVVTAFAASGLHFNMEGLIRHLARRVAESCRPTVIDPIPAPAPSPARSSALPALRAPG